MTPKTLNDYWDEKSRLIQERGKLVQNWTEKKNRQLSLVAQEAILGMRLDPQKAFDWIFWTLDPRDRANPKKEFIPMPYQRVMIAWIMDAIHQGYDLAQEKSRDMGATWIDLTCLLWCWLFEDEFSAHLLSKSEVAVDSRDDKNSLFERMRWQLRMIEQATPGIVPPLWEKSSGILKLVNPLNGSVITGGATVANFARQGRYNVIMLDEFASIESKLQEEAWIGTKDATPCRIVLSTPKGLANRYASICMTLRKEKGARIDMLKAVA